MVIIKVLETFKKQRVLLMKKERRERRKRKGGRKREGKSKMKGKEEKKKKGRKVRWRKTQILLYLKCHKFKINGIIINDIIS